MKKIVFILIMLITLSSNAQFCNKYADKAVAQYKLAKKNNLPDISWPLWTDDWNGHYNWCKTVTKDVANKETGKRQAYLDKYIKPATPYNKESFCNAYADKAIQQFTQAAQLHLPDMNPLLWNNNRDLHIKWCMAVPENTATEENNKRQKLIDDFINSNQKVPKQNPGKVAEYKYVKIAVLPDPSQIIKIKENTCKNYAKESIRLIKLNKSKRCNLNISYKKYWSDEENYDNYKDWCMHDNNYLKAEKILNEKIKKLKACRGVNTIWVPGMVIGLRHSINNKDDIFIPSYDYYPLNHDENHQKKLQKNSTTDVEVKSDVNPQIIKQWRYYTVIDGDFPEAYKYNLPPGIVINLRGRYTQHIIEFGIGKEDIKNYYYGYHFANLSGPEYYGGGRFHKEIGGDLGDKAGSGLSWYESTGLGFKDWSQVNNLPRGTVIGLKHSLNQPNKKLIWQGVIFDPVDPNIKPPPGFVRKVGGDLGAPAGEGYFWYEKITGK